MEEKRVEHTRSTLNMLDRIIAGVIAVFIAALIGGTIVWIIWPYVIPVVFPELVVKGFIIGKIDWWTAVLLNWLMGCLFRAVSAS